MIIKPVLPRTHSIISGRDCQRHGCQCSILWVDVPRLVVNVSKLCAVIPVFTVNVREAFNKILSSSDERPGAFCPRSTLSNGCIFTLPTPSPISQTCIRLTAHLHGRVLFSWHHATRVSSKDSRSPDTTSGPPDVLRTRRESTYCRSTDNRLPCTTSRPSAFR